MSQRTRIKKLEETGRSGITVVMPVFKNEDDETITSSSLPETVAVACIYSDGFSIARELEEAPEEFYERVMRTAHERYKPCVVLPHYVANI